MTSRTRGAICHGARVATCLLPPARLWSHRPGAERTVEILGLYGANMTPEVLRAVTPLLVAQRDFVFAEHLQTPTRLL